jgi:hypothetical protein
MRYPANFLMLGAQDKMPPRLDTIDHAARVDQMIRDAQERSSA